MKSLRRILPLACSALLVASQAHAVTQLVGDVDGFGIDPDGLSSATGDPVDVDGDGLLEEGEYLPDLNGNATVAIGSFDSFDNRSAAELAATDGAQWTDYAIEGIGFADGAAFVFAFSPPVFGDSDYGVDHYINLVFADYDVVPAQLLVDGEVVELTLQSNAGGEDGLIQAAYAIVPWSDIADGSVEIVVDAPEEPYLAFDYALLDTDAFADFDEDGVPDGVDNCLDTPNSDQLDGDGDGIGDACDLCTEELPDTVVLPYLARDYRYLQVEHDGEPGFESPAYDDSAWSLGDAGFGSQNLHCPLNNPVDAPTFWETETDMLLRRTFWLPDPTSGLRIGVAIDNDIQIWVNGEDVTGELVIHENCPERDAFIFDVPDDVLVSGYNLLAVRARDRHVVSYVDVQIIGDLCVPGCVDPDEDDVCVDDDNCPDVENGDQADGDDDGFGDACDECPADATNDGSDGDGVCDDVDNCLGVGNADQTDGDEDGLGDACDECPADATNDGSDGDGVCDDVDNCLGVANPDQADGDSDGAGDACDVCPGDPTDDASDGDEICDDVDNCVGTRNSDQLDSDGDGVGDACDVCPFDADDDADGDGVCGEIDYCPGTSIPERTVPRRRLGFGRFALVDGDGVFDTGSVFGHTLDRTYTIERTGGCSCEQMLQAWPYGRLNALYGCNVFLMEAWIRHLP